MYHFHPAILAANHQINHEAVKTLRQNLFVKLTTKAPGHELDLEVGDLPLVAKYDLATPVTYCASELTLVLPSATCDDCPLTFMFAGNDMTIFCRVLLRCCFQGSLSIAITGLAPPRTSVSQLLEPFRRLHSLASVTIIGQISDAYKSDLVATTLLQAPEFDAVIQNIEDTIGQGDRAAKDKEYSTAITKYEEALLDDDDYQCHFAKLKADSFSGDNFHKLCVQIPLDLSTRIATNYLNLENHGRAQQWVTFALAQSRFCGGISPARPGGVSYSMIYSIAAHVSEVLGLIQQAVGAMKWAVWYDPGKLEFAMELARLEGKMQSGEGLKEGWVWDGLIETLVV